MEVLFHPNSGQIYNIKLVEHGFETMVGRFELLPYGGARTGIVVYEKKNTREEIYIPEAPKEVKDKDWVKIRLQFQEKGQHKVTGEVVKVYGQELPASADVEWVASEYRLVEEHSPESIAQAEAFELDLDLQNRKDLRNIPFITIDGITARDFDDAIYVERTGNGWVLWVAIADVSFYVTKDSAIDKGAFSRGTSVYFPERAFHMLPRALSENLCSLRPNEPRLAMVAKMTMDGSGNRKETEIMNAVILSRRRATYEEIQQERDQNLKNPKWEYAPHYELYEQLRRIKRERGSIDFDLPEPVILVDDQGNPTEIVNRDRLDSHRLIEEFMIAANEASTEWILEKGWPFIFRVHEEPSHDSLLTYQKLAASFGANFPIREGDMSRIISKYVRDIDKHPAKDVLNMALLRSMKQAIYTATHGIHFGLASEAYTHFTSPIRRYPDLLVHRMLKLALIHKTPRNAEQLEQDLQKAADHCSYRERLAADAERESRRIKQVRYMTRHLGDEFEGKINGMNKNGFFVQLDEPYVDGMVPKDSLTDDFYEFNEDKMLFYGKRKKRVYKVGDRVRIQVVRADLLERRIDFSLTEHLTPSPLSAGKKGKAGKKLPR